MMLMRFSRFLAKKLLMIFEAGSFHIISSEFFAEPLNNFLAKFFRPPWNLVLVVPLETWCLFPPCLVGTLQATRGREINGRRKPHQDWGIRYIRGVMGRIRGCGTLPEKQLKVYKAPHLVSLEVELLLMVQKSHAQPTVWMY